MEALNKDHVKKEKLGRKCEFKENLQGLKNFKGWIWVPKHGRNLKLALNDSYKSKYFIHPWSIKTYRDLKGYYWLSRIKPKVAKYILKCLTFAQVKSEHQAPYGKTQSL